MTVAIHWDHATLDELFTTPAGPVGVELERLAVQVEDTAKSLVSRTGSGRVYTRGGVSHQAAAPGEPFSAENPDILRDSIGHTLTLVKGALVARVGTDELVGLYQEIGTRKMPAHPWLRPALISVQGGSAASISRVGRKAVTRLKRQQRAARALGRALTAAPRQQRRELLAAKRIGRALSAGPRQQRRELVAAKRIGRALRGLG